MAASSPFALTLPPQFGYVVLTGAASVLLTQWQGFKVGMQRRKCGLKYPKRPGWQGASFDLLSLNWGWVHFPTRACLVGGSSILTVLKFHAEMYEDKEDSLFNCYQRAHQNTLESYPAFMSLLLLGGLGYPVVSSVFGMIWVVGRVFYSVGYYSGDPKKRLQGAWHVFGLLGLLVTTCVLGVRLALPA